GAALVLPYANAQAMNLHLELPAALRNSPETPSAISAARRRRGVFHWRQRAARNRSDVAAFAAGAEAHLTGELAVCAGSCGPGNLHLINGLFDCHRSRVPVLAIAAQIPSADIGAGYFQETRRRCSGSAVTIASRSPAPTR